MTRVVLDTNILVSAALSAAGNESDVVELCRTGRLTACVTQALLAEDSEVLGRDKFRFSRQRLDPLLSFLRTNSLTVEPVADALASPDPSASKFIAWALAARADVLVTGNRRHFPEPRSGAATVVNARELLARLD